MKRMDIIIFIIYMLIGALFPYDERNRLLGRLVFLALMVIYPIFYYIYHHFILRIVLKYFKEYLKDIVIELEKEIGEKIANEIILDIILPFNIYKWNDFEKIIVQIDDYLVNCLQLDEKQKHRLKIFFDEKEFQKYIKRIAMEKRNNSLKQVSLKNSWEEFWINYIHLTIIKTNTWKKCHPQIFLIFIYFLFSVDLYIIFRRNEITLGWILFESIVTILSYICYISKSNKRMNEHAVFILYWIFGIVSNTYFIMESIPELFLKPITIIIFLCNFLLDIIWGNKIINTMFGLNEEKVYKNTKEIDKVVLDNIVYYRYIIKYKYVVLWTMFVFIIIFNILDFTCINFSILRETNNMYYSNRDLFELCFKNAVSIYFTNELIIDFEYKNSFLVNISQTILVYFTNILLIANIVKYLTEEKK